MKKITDISIAMIMAALVISGCAKKAVPDDGALVLVKMNLTGEVTVDETPLTRAFTSDDLIGVQVYQGSEYYAYGLFDDVSKMSIYLHSGKTYKFVCTVVKNGKNILYLGQRDDRGNGCSIPSYITTESGSYGLSEGQYGLPFLVLNMRYMSDRHWVRSYMGMAVNNAFNYDNERYFDSLQYGSITVNNRSTNQNYPPANRFYGEISDYTAAGDGVLSIPLKRTSFGVALSVSGITDGDVTVTIRNSDQIFLSNSGITQDTQFGTTTWGFFNVKSAWQYADNYAENFTVSVVWNRGVGVTQDLGARNVQFKRNTTNHVRINLTTTINSSSLGVSLEEPNIGHESFLICN